jgi:hypothetical protein
MRKSIDLNRVHDLRFEIRAEILSQTTIKRSLKKVTLKLRIYEKKYSPDLNQLQF